MGEVVAYERSEKLKPSQKQSPILRRTALLHIKLRERHKVPVRQSDNQSSEVESDDIGCSHHDDVRDAACEARNPETGSTTQFRGHDTSERRADEGAEGHEGGDELLAFGGEVPAIGGFGGAVAVDLWERSQKRCFQYLSFCFGSCFRWHLP